MPFKFDPDGSLDLYFQNESPGADKEANWLLAPKGPFNLTIRLYAPKSDALTGKWNPPPVRRQPRPRYCRRNNRRRRPAAVSTSRVAALAARLCVSNR